MTNDYARELMHLFVDHFGQSYGVTSLVYNLHGLTHLADDAKLYGSLGNISSFPFENFIKDLQKLVRKPSFMLSQVIRRLSEKKTVKSSKNKVTFKKEHNNGPFPD